MGDASTIRIAATVLRNQAGEMLLVRKRGTKAFMQPGGKIEPHEAPEGALSRELYEGLGLTIEADAFRYLGNHVASAANEPVQFVEAEVYLAPVLGTEPSPGAEIEEMAWVGSTTPDGLVLAPLTRDEVLPRYLRPAD